MSELRFYENWFAVRKNGVEYVVKHLLWLSGLIIKNASDACLFELLPTDLSIMILINLPNRLCYFRCFMWVLQSCPKEVPQCLWLNLVRELCLRWGSNFLENTFKFWKYKAGKVRILRCICDKDIGGNTPIYIDILVPLFPWQLW